MPAPLLALVLLAAPGVDFAQHIRPVLTAKCVRCHGSKRQEGGLRLDVRVLAQQGGDSGPALGKSGEILRRLLTTDPDQRMPPDGNLPAADLARLKAWLAADSPWPDAFAGRVVVQHWAFLPIARPPIPTLHPRDQLRSPIDAILQARLDKEKLPPSSEADRHTLLRRLHLDLLGLPPTPDQINAFVTDLSPNAYERLVDRLLSSPHFGERWGRHWLDLARFAESDGYENDRLRPNAWRWRDWVIDAINADMPHDRFTIEQLAGDLLPNATTTQKVATGLHRNTLHNSAASGDKEEFRTYAVKDATETTATAWMGLTLACASCHSHKYDPISIREYYSLYAFFNATDGTDIPVPGGKAPTLRSLPRPTHIHLRGSYLRPGTKVDPGTPAFLPPLQVRGKQADRLDLARWLVDPTHPLTARVAVNQIWQHLFGAGLIPTPENFGASGEPPAHPELLDWLASELVRQDWSRKAIIRTIVLSHAYRQSSIYRPDLRPRDPNNRLLARQNRFRVEAEIVHDLALSAAGLLRSQVGGPSFVPPFPRELPVGQFTAEALKQPTKERHRRGTYIHVQRTLTHPLLGAFDVADGNQPCTRRARSETAIQALALLNDPTYHEAAVALGERLRKEPAANRLTAAFALTLGRLPTRGEREVLEDLIARQLAVRTSDAVVWSGIARVLLNLEAFTTRE